MQGRNTEKEIFDIEKNMLEISKPNNWNIYVQGNSEVEIDNEFQKLIISLSEFANGDVEHFSVFKFYNLIEILNEKSAENGKGNN